MASPDRELWMEAMNDELRSLETRETYDVVEKPAGVKIISLKWVYAYKTDEEGRVVRHKARVVAKGFMQREGIDYTEVYAPVCTAPTRRTVLALAAQHGWHVHHVDVKTAFLDGNLQEEIYTGLPPGFDMGASGKVWRLRKALYGLKQAPKSWHEELAVWLKDDNFIVSKADAGLWHKMCAECDAAYLDLCR